MSTGRHKFVCCCCCCCSRCTRRRRLCAGRHPALAVCGARTQLDRSLRVCLVVAATRTLDGHRTSAVDQPPTVLHVWSPSIECAPAATVQFSGCRSLGRWRGTTNCGSRQFVGLTKPEYGWRRVWPTHISHSVGGCRGIGNWCAYGIGMCVQCQYTLNGPNSDGVLVKGSAVTTGCVPQIRSSSTCRCDPSVCRSGQPLHPTKRLTQQKQRKAPKCAATRGETSPDCGNWDAEGSNR